VDGVARFDARRRAGLFDEAGARRGVSSIIIEKDFWVCWALKHLFGHADAAAFIFKGGTSLSKAFGVIRRFSEDIDVSIDRKMLGYAGDRDPGAAPSGTKAQQLLKSLSQDLETYLHDKLLPAMTDGMGDAPYTSRTRTSSVFIRSCGSHGQRETEIAAMPEPSKRSSPSSIRPELLLVFVERLRQQAEAFQRTVEGESRTVRALIEELRVRQAKRRGHGR